MPRHLKSRLLPTMLTFTSTIFLANCSSDSDSDTATSTATPVAGEEVALTAPSPAGVLALTVNAIDDTLNVNALDASVESGSLRLAPVEIETTPDQPDQDSDGDGKLESSADDATNYSPDPNLPACSQYGDPMANSTTLLSEQDETFPKAKTDCLISTPNASESLAGSISQVKGILCTFEKALGDPIEFLPDPGKSYENVTVTVTIDTDCFTAAQVESMSEGGSNQFTLNMTATLDETKSLPNRIVIQLPDGPITIDLLITEDVFSFAKMETNDNSEPADLTVVTMERGAGIIRAIRKSMKQGGSLFAAGHGRNC